MKNKFLQFLSSMRRGAAMLLLLLTCVTHAWAGPTFGGGYVYFENKGGWTDASKQLCIGRDKWKDDWTEVRDMGIVANTLLWYNSLPTSGWGDATYMGVIGNSSGWESNNWGSGNLKNANHYTGAASLGNYEFKSGHVHKLTPANGNNGATLSLSWIGDASSSLNQTVTVRAKVSTDGGASYNNANTPGALTANSYKFSNYTTCGTGTSCSLSAGSSSTSLVTGYTANTTVTAADATDYTFMGWYEGDSKILSTNNGTMNPHGAVTLYAYYKKDLWTVAGSGAVMGVNWDPTADSNDMTKVATNTYTLTKKNVKLTAETEYACKVVRDHSSSYVEAYPASDKTFSVSTTGYYDVTFTFNTSTYAVTVTTVLWDAASITSGSATINITLENIASSKSLEYKLYAGESAAGDPLQTVSTTTTTTSHSQSFSVTPSFGASDINKKYTLRITYDGVATDYTNVVGRKWDIYVHDVQSWGGVKQHHWGNYGSSDYPGSACSQYKSPSTWYTVTIDGKYNTGFVLSKSSDNTKKTVDLIPSITTFPAGSYWYISYADSKYGLTSAGTVVAPTVTLTVDKVNVNQITVTGTVTNCGGDGTTAADMKEVGFKVNGTTYAATFKSGTSFKKTITGLTANTDISIKAYATNIIGTSESAAKDTTTYANTNYRVKVRVDHGETAPKVYAWTDADDYGGSKMENGTYKSQSAATLLFAASTYDWYYCDLNNKYENFLIYTTGDRDKSGDFPATRVTDCYWYDADGSPKKAEQMDCPMLEPHLAVKTSKAGADTYYEMSEDDGVASLGKSLTAGTYYIKVVYATEYYGKGADYANTIARTGNTTSNAINDVVVNGGYITLTADFDGTYTFSFDESGKDLTVTYPTAYTVTYSKSIIGTDNSTTAAPTATYNSGATSVTSTHYVPASTSVTFAAASAGTGYEWKGWYKIADPSADYSANKLSGSANFVATISKDTTIYAVYKETIHTVSVVANDGYGNDKGGTVDVASVSAGIASVSATITATPTNKAWRFRYWEVPGDGSITIVGGDNTASSITINATADSKTITAHFQPRYGLVGSRNDGSDTPEGMPGWNNANSADFVVVGFDAVDKTDGVDLESTRTLLPNRRYKFKVLDRVAGERRGQESSTADMPANTNWELSHGNDVFFWTSGYGDYTFHITKMSSADNYFPSLQIDYPNAYELTMGKKVIYNEDNTSLTNATTEGSVTAHTNENTVGYDILSGQYFASGSNITFTATPADGYEVEGWYNNEDCAAEHKYTAGSNVTISGDKKTLTLSSLTTATTVYVKFVENSTAVTIAHNEHGHVTVGGEIATSTTVGITTTRALVAVPDAGYYFAGWTVPVGADFELQGNDDEEDAEVTLHGLGAGTAGTLTANFVEEDKIYFRNIDQSTGEKLWDKDHIYIYFGTTWYDGKGVQTLSNYAEMSPFGSTKIYWAYVPHAFTKSKNTHVAFSDVDMHSNSEFYNNKGVYRTDYSRITNMFVPHHTTSGTTNGTVYHSNGYWKVFDPQIGVGQGYYLQLHTGVDGEGKGTYDEKGEFTAVANGSSKIAYTMRVDNTSTQRTYRIVSAGGVHYTASTTITSAAYEDVTVNEYNNCSNCYFEVTPTSEGDYKFILDQSEDYMKLTVEYPVSTGDYRLKHTYNDGSAKTTYSDVIKSSGASTSRTLSMYLNASSGTLVLQKCTTIDAGVPAWDAGDAENLGGILTTVETNGKGVYKFDVAVSGDKVSLAPTATKYTGPYYIKTDGANGGWVNYKQNFMDENTLNYDTNHPEKSFNYYYCKYYKKDGYNLKCVIANDYCNALTDTLIGDDVLGVLDAKPRQTTPSAVSVRFSYNSYTNEIKRSYLGASMEDDFLRIEGDQTASKPHIYDKGESTFDDTHADEYIKFEDKQNWRYEIEINADVNARAKLTASFNDQTQYFMGAAGEFSDANTEQLFGGAGGTYGLSLVYDFKTNKLIRAWKPTATTISEDLTLKSDVLLLREHQGAPAEITFGTIGETDVYASLTNVKTVYSVLRFNRWKLNNRAHPEDTNSDHCNSSSAITTHHPALTVNQDNEAGKWLPQAERELYFISFPYDVKMSDIIHFGGYYDKWGIMYYDGKNRAKNGYWIDSDSNWKYFTPEEFATGTLNAYEGYLIGIDLEQMRYDNTSFWTNNSSEVDIYFPSKEPVSTITQKEVTVSIDTVGYQCKINRTYGGNDGDRRIKDSHWHCIGVPAYADLSHDINNGEPDDETWSEEGLLYLYEWNPVSNDHSIKDASTFNFQAMYAYLVQYAGTTLSWSAAAATGPAPTPVAARRMKTEELRDRQFNLQLMQGGKEADHTYIRLSDDEEVTTGFEFNHDVSKMMLSGANIYTLIGTEQAAANSLPLNLEQTTIVPVGVKIATAGDYTFAIPEGTDGVGVVLIDNIAGTRTNLALTDYEVSLTSGKIEDRFVLEISPIQHTPTGIDNVQGESAQSAKARKVMIDGILYIVKDGKVFDACGNRVK